MSILSDAPARASIPNFTPKQACESVPVGGACDDQKGADLAPLGTTAKYAAISQSINPETGEIIQTEKPFSPMDSRVQRFALQSIARKFLPKFRTASCMRWRQKDKHVEVWQSKEFKTASYGGLQTCGSVWACPVCAAKIAERRRSEIISAMTLHKAAGGSVTLLTLTAPHSRTDKLSDLLQNQSKALRYFWADRSSREIFKQMGIIGQIRALEVTHGRKSASNNGWHPHYHILQFGGLKGAFTPFQLYEWADSLYVRWASCCVRAGLGEPSRLHGLKLDDGSKASAYVAKWGLEDEMTKGHTKKSAQGETPFDFLRSHLADSSDKQAGILFKEFAESFKGKRQLHWSHGLKKHFKIGESTDEELSLQLDDCAELLGRITPEQWRAVLKADLRGELLLVAAAGGWSAVILLLEQLPVEANKTHEALFLDSCDQIET
jgi:hypothetical protein